ncbi:MAG TPA: LD-carboxypeptidase, partial [Caldithrix abyssi]|nr:LD-carboxypeptidase [Caldithrix abyssi]
MLKPLPPKGNIGVLAPAFPPNPEKLEKGIQYLKGMGFTVVRGESLSARHWYFAGNDTLRAHELNRMFADPDIDAIICARGGWGTLRLLDQLDYALIKANPKMLVGYSDITTLHLAIWSRAGLPGISGPMVAVEMGTGIVPFTETHFWQQVGNTQKDYRFDFGAESIEIWNGGQASGTLLGGCLSMIAHQLGTPYSPDYSGAILFIEDV